MQQIDTGHFDSALAKKIIGSVNKIVKEVYEVDQELVGLKANVFELRQNRSAVDDPDMNRVDEIRINMRGIIVTSSVETLKKIEGSRLANLCEQVLMKPGKTIFIDRESGPFKQVLTYLESNQKQLPLGVTNEEKRLVEEELKHWQITTLDFEHATCKNLL